ncbi:MAG: sensor histidine kinase [Pseudomonadota bacterium]|nr:sensor histidine kinase [Pseudomonadota bacterium]
MTFLDRQSWRTAGLQAVMAVITITLALASLPAPAATIVLDGPALQRGYKNLEGHLEAFHDTSGQLTQAQVASAPVADRFEPLKGHFNGGFAGSGAWWLRFTVSAEPGRGDHWWLQLIVPYVDFVDVWLPQRLADGSEALQHRSMGGMRPVSQRDVATPSTVVRLDFSADATPRTVWIRVAGHRTLSLAGALWQLEPMMELLQLSFAQEYTVTGMVILMALLALILGVSLPDRTFLSYAAYLGASGLLFLSSEHLLAVLFIPDQPVLAVRIHNLSMCLSLLTAVTFAYRLLDLPVHFPHVARVFRVLIWVSVAALVVSAAGHYGSIAAALNLVRIALALVIVVLCAVLVKRRLPGFLPNLIGYATYALLGSIHFAKNLDWIPYTGFNQYGFLIGVLIHMVAIFIGLGMRVRMRERQALADSLAAGARLEVAVTERTHALHTEITEHKITEEQLRVAMEEQRNFLAMVSHEFRTPISVIGASSQMIVDERMTPGPEDVQREAGKIGRAAQRMTALIDTLLADEWLASSAMQLNPRELDVSAMLQQVRDRYEPGSVRSISVECGTEPLLCRADPMLLGIALDNLIENAIKYSPAGEPIELRGWREDGHVCISVRDHGAGLKDAETEQVFERFYRSQEVKRLPGIGLGLFMVKRIAVLHGGSVHAGNANGGGAVFTVRLSGTDPRAAH